MVRKPFKYKTLIWDLETDGLLQELTRVHILVIIESETGRKWVFRRNRREDTILDGIAMLNDAEMIVGHSIVGFDMPALWKVYGDAFDPRGKVRDTVVMSRMCMADVKEKDIKLWKRGELEGRYIGSHELAAWGQRLNFQKDDYSKRKAAELKERYPEKSKEEINRLVWRTWNQEMEDYGVIDVEVTDLLWKKILRYDWPEAAVVLEHQIHALMERVTENGFPFDLEAAAKLETELRTQFDEKTRTTKEHFAFWHAPAKWHKNDPREELGEDRSRAWWGEVAIPARTTKFTKPDKNGLMKADRLEGAAYCPIKTINFNPNSRVQIVNRLEKVYGWEPQEFTDPSKQHPKGQAKVNDEILRDLGKTAPIAIDLAELFYLNKRLGQLVDGPAGWIGKAQERGDSCIHGRINVGGTVTNRASHSGPNIAQVPKVQFRKLPLLDADGNPVFDDEGKPVLQPKKTMMKGRAGEHGYDCRNLFTVRPGFILLGADQSGIELRCLSHYMHKHDEGAYGKLCVESDPHDLHMEVLELNSRDTAKTWVYAWLYGAADYKLGITLDPDLAFKPVQAKALGAESRRRITTRIPALGAVAAEVQREARKGFVVALDGRRLYVRHMHAALNTKLQGAGATVAKMWCVRFEILMEEAGLVHGWDGDFAVLAWIHDEQQVAVRDDPRIKTIAEKCMRQAAKEAGDILQFKLPVDIDCKWGYTWAQTH